MLAGATDVPELIVQISDMHIGYPSGPVDPERALQLAVEEILAIRPAPVAVLLSGDLTHNGKESEYRRLRQLLAPLTMPVHPMMGNHDQRQALCAAFADHPGVAAASSRDWLSYAVDCGGLRVVCLDSSVPGSDAGRLEEDQLAWLVQELAAGNHSATLVALHHPPILTGMDEFDRISLTTADRAALARALEGVSGLEKVVSGHIHRTLVGRLGATPTLVCPSVFMQAQLNLTPHGALRLVPGGKGLAIHIQRSGQPLLTHIHAIERV